MFSLNLLHLFIVLPKKYISPKELGWNNFVMKLEQFLHSVSSQDLI